MSVQFMYEVVELICMLSIDTWLSYLFEEKSDY